MLNRGRPVEMLQNIKGGLYKCSLIVSFLMQTGFFSTTPKVFHRAKEMVFHCTDFSLRDAASLTFPIHSRADFFTELANA